MSKVAPREFIFFLLRDNLRASNLNSDITKNSYPFQVNLNSKSVSIFVNEIQFNSSADFKSYPRTLKEDLIKLQRENVDIVFVPNKEQMNTINNPFTFDFKFALM